MEKRFKKYHLRNEPYPEIGSFINTAKFDMSQAFFKCEVVDIIKETHKYTGEEQTFALLYHPEWDIIQDDKIPNTFSIAYCIHAPTCGNKECRERQEKIKMSESALDV